MEYTDQIESIVEDVIQRRTENQRWVIEQLEGTIREITQERNEAWDEVAATTLERTKRLWARHQELQGLLLSTHAPDILAELSKNEQEITEVLA